MLVTGRTRTQCSHRWHDALDPRIALTAGRKGKWTAAEDSQLKHAVQTHGVKDWAVIAALVPGRTRSQCYKRWHDVLDPSIDRASAPKGKKWSAVEDSKLKDAVKTYGDKDWGALSALVPGRTNKQCSSRWHGGLDPNVGRASGRKGTWKPDEDAKLRSAVQTHGDKGWAEISALLPGRTKQQCNQRWHYALKPSIALTAGRKGKWTAVEDSKLKDAIQTHGDKDWVALAALVPGRTRTQCQQRWHNGLNPSIDWANGRTGKWAEDEDSKLKDAVKTHGDKDWAVNSALVPGRTRTQCYWRWHNGLNPSIDRASGRNG
jgi:myb proto-oncogene protein